MQQQQQQQQQQRIQYNKSDRYDMIWYDMIANVLQYVLLYYSTKAIL
jgi:hypothetical protein